MNGKGLVAILTLTVSLLGFLALTMRPNVTATITCSGDAFVFQGMPSLNTGAYQEISASITWSDGTPTDLRYIYIMFDLSSIPPYAVVTDVRLQIYVFYVGAFDRAAGGTLKESEKGQIYGCTWAETNWAENTITWLKQPTSGLPGFWHAHLFGGKVGFKGGWFTWRVGGTAERLMNHLKTDKKMAYIIAPDVASGNRPQYCDTSSFKMYTKEKGGGFEPKLYVDYYIPSYTLTVQVKSADGLPIKGAVVKSPFTASTDASGAASRKLQAGSYNVTVEYSGYTYSQQVTLTSNQTVTITVPKYVLTIKVVDAEGNPLPGATISQPATGTTDTMGTFTVNLPKGRYLVKANVGTKEASQTVDLTSDKTVTLTIAVEFTLRINVKDQCGNPLPAAVIVDGQTAICNEYGVVTFVVPSGTHNIQALIDVKDRSFSANKTVTITKHTVLDVVVKRRFYWCFFFNYTDGTVPARGKITLTHAKEVLEVPLINGVGEAYLLDGIYRITVEASPPVDLGLIEVDSDGKVFYTLNKEIARLEEKEETTIKPGDLDYPIKTPRPEIPEIPWILIPSVYIYTLVAVLAFGFIVAGMVALRRKR